MIQITMLKTESLSTSTGPVTYKIGETYFVEPWIASSLLGRGFARMTDAAPSIVSDELNYDGLNVANLRELAKQYSIPGYKKMHRTELINILKEHRAQRLVPLPPPLEILDNSAALNAPVFKKE